MPSPSKRAASAKPEFEETFATLRDVLRKQAPKALIVKDAPGDFQIASPTLVDRAGRPLALGAVQIKKNYVSFHLIPVYAIPALAKTVSPSLKKRMQGKSCFNFTSVEPAHVKEPGRAHEEGRRRARRCRPPLGQQAAVRVDGAKRAMSRRRLSIASTIERAAQALPDVTCGVACKGTTLEARTFATGKKTFLFVGAKDARLKLADSAKEASALADAVRVGAGGWTRISLEGDVRLTPAVLTRWVEESYRLVVGPAVGRPASRPPKKR